MRNFFFPSDRFYISVALLCHPRYTSKVEVDAIHFGEEFSNVKHRLAVSYIVHGKGEAVVMMIKLIDIFNLQLLSTFPNRLRDRFDASRVEERSQRRSELFR